MIFEYNEKENHAQIELQEKAVFQKNSNRESIEIPYSHVRNIRHLINSAETRKCIISSKSGEKVVIRNDSFSYVGDDEVITEDYNRFLEELHKKTAKYKNISYNVGYPFLFYFMVIAFPVLLTLYFIYVILGILYPEKIDIPISPTLLAIIMTVLFFVTIKKGNGTYCPHNIPERCFAGLAFEKK